MEFLPSHKLMVDFGIDKLLQKHIEEKKIESFDEFLIEKIKKTNVFGIKSFYEIFEMGLNIGTCGLTAKYVSFSFENVTIVTEGKCEILIGTPGAEFGQHAWLEVEEESEVYVYDTTLMLKIAKDIAYEELGYMPKTKLSIDDLKKDDSYMFTKKISKDQKSLNKKQAIAEAFRKFSEDFN